MNVKQFKYLMLIALAALGITALGCAPLVNKNRADAEGKFMVTSSKIFDNDSSFDIRDVLIYPRPDRSLNPSINVTDKELAIGTESSLGRCNRCHDCGFEQAWDMQAYQTPDWSPRYTGEEWQPVVQRMRNMDNSLINEAIADRLFSFLRDETLGVYDEAADPRGAITIDVEEEPRDPGPRPGERPQPHGQF